MTLTIIWLLPIEKKQQKVRKRRIYKHQSKTKLESCVYTYT